MRANIPRQLWGLALLFLTLLGSTIFSAFFGYKTLALIALFVTVACLLLVGIRYIPKHLQRFHFLFFLALMIASASMYALGTTDFFTDVYPLVKQNDVLKRIPRGLLLVALAILFFAYDFRGPYWAIRTRIFLRHDRSILQALNRFLASSKAERKGCSEWFHLIHLAASAALSKNHEVISVWVDPESYMNLHVAASLLATNYYYSCFKAPDSVWEFLSTRGGCKYARILLSRELKESRRYVLCDDPEKAKRSFAVSDFLLDARRKPFPVAVTQGIKVIAIANSEACTNRVHDFSIFAIDEGWIAIRMKPEFEESVSKAFERLSRDYTAPNSPAEREVFERELAKIPFKAEIRFMGADSHESLPPNDALRKQLMMLEAALGKQILPSDLTT